MGSRPLYEVRVRISPDPERHFPAKGKATYDILEQVLRRETRIDVGTLGPSNFNGNYPSVMVPVELGSSETRRQFSVFFSSRNDFFTQYMRFARVGERWFAAYRVVRQHGGSDAETLIECQQAGFPADALDWQPKVARNPNCPVP
jgi:hypothetical protein